MQEGHQTMLVRIKLEREVEEFLYMEADLLDERRFTEWLDLLSEDIHYWVPMQRNVKFGDWEHEPTREGSDINWFEEGKGILRLRVKQLMSGEHWSEEPISRTSHLVTNIRVLEVTPSEDQPVEVKVKCRFLIYRNKLEDESDFFVGKREDVLRKIDGCWKISRRKAILDQNVLLAQTMPTFI